MKVQFMGGKGLRVPIFTLGLNQGSIGFRWLVERG